MSQDGSSAHYEPKAPRRQRLVGLAVDDILMENTGSITTTTEPQFSGIGITADSMVGYMDARRRVEGK